MANITTQTIRVDLSTDKVIPSAFTHQNDTARTLVFDMYNGGMPYTMTGNTVKFAYKSPIVNGQYSVIAGASMASGTVSGNKVTVTLPSAYTAVSGVGMLTMIITPTSGTVRPVNIRLVVQKSADGDDTVMGASDWPEGLYDYMDNWLAENEPTEIANLKSALSYIDSGSGNINFGELVPNEYVDSANGSFVSYNNWSRTKFIDISLFATIAVKYGYQSEYNAFYDANRTFISNFTVRTSLTPLTVPSNAKYIVLSSTILGMNSLIGEFTTKQDDTINSLSTNVSALTEKTANISNELISQINIHYGTGGWVQGSWGAIADWANPNANESATRIKQELSVQSGNPITISIGTGYKFNYAAFTSEGTLLEYKLNFATDSIYLNYSDISTVRVIVAKADDGNITPSEYVESGISVYDFGSYIPVKLKVMSYNIGRYSHGTSPYYLDSDFDTKVANLKKFFAEQKCDFVGLQEANDYLDSETIGTKSANDYVYDYLYPYHRDLNGLTSLKSKYKLIGSGTGTFSTGREYVYGVLQLGNKNIYVMSVHLTPNAGQEAARANERAEIRTLMSNHKYAICCGDFNAQDSAEFDDFISNGFHIANGGYLPAVNTYGGLTVFQERNPMDNIVTTSNIIIDYSERLNVFNELVSDHVPFIAHLTVN